MRGCFAAISIILFGLSAIGQAPLTGKADPIYTGQKIQLFALSDYITYELDSLSVDTVAMDGSFVLPYQVPKATLCKLYIGEITAYLYLDPQESLEVFFPAYTSIERLILSKEKVVQLKFNSQNGALNQNILQHNKIYDEFVAEHFYRFQNNNAHTVVDSFLVATKDSCLGCEQKYYQAYRDYNRAILRLNSNASKPQLYQDYLKGREVLLANDAYVDFIKQFYKGYFQNVSLSANATALKKSINAFKSVPKLMEVIERDTLLTHPQLQEWVALTELYANYHNEVFDRNSILWMIKALAESANYLEHRKIAHNMVSNLTRLGPGSRAPEFALKAFNDSIVALRDFRGQYVYLQFWAPWCTSCINDMTQIRAYQKKYGSSISFISVMIQTDSSDQSYARMMDNFDWIFLKDNLGPGSLQTRYDVRTVPLYFLISKEGYLEQCQAAGPGYAIERRLYNIDKANFPDKYRHNLIIQD
ncbi:MAG: TlpA family protein disulfide reductase [Salibacteraceae bacterium]